MTMKLGFRGYYYDDEFPLYFTYNFGKLTLNRVAFRIIETQSLLEEMERLGYTPKAYEIGTMNQRWAELHRGPWYSETPQAIVTKGDDNSSLIVKFDGCLTL
jgi:hypothetical protein